MTISIRDLRTEAEALQEQVHVINKLIELRKGMSDTKRVCIPDVGTTTYEAPKAKRRYKHRSNAIGKKQGKSLRHVPTSELDWSTITLSEGIRRLYPDIKMADEFIAKDVARMLKKKGVKYSRSLGDMAAVISTFIATKNEGKKMFKRVRPNDDTRPFKYRKRFLTIEDAHKLGMAG